MLGVMLHHGLPGGGLVVNYDGGDLSCREAERLAVLEEEMKHTDALEGVELDDPTLKSALIHTGPGNGSSGSDNRAVIIINAQSNIVITNDAVFPILGYTKSELKGKALRIILPPTVADFHLGYVRNYIQTGKGNELITAHL
jgi:PAS domain-containing protein